MCRYPEEMKLGSIGTTGEGRDIKVEKKKEEQIFSINQSINLRNVKDIQGKNLRL